MIKIRLGTFEISDKEFDEYCMVNRVGRNTARRAIKKMLEDRVHRYTRDLTMLSEEINSEMHESERAWALRYSKRTMSEKEIREQQYKMFKGEKR